MWEGSSDMYPGTHSEGWWHPDVFDLISLQCWYTEHEEIHQIKLEEVDHSNPPYLRKGDVCRINGVEAKIKRMQLEPFKGRPQQYIYIIREKYVGPEDHSKKDKESDPGKE